MQRITTEQLREMLDAHERYLKDPKDGKELFLYNADLSGTDWHGAYAHYITLINVKLRMANMEGVEVQDSIFINVDFSVANLYQADFENCKFEGCNFENARTREAYFEGAEEEWTRS